MENAKKIEINISVMYYKLIQSTIKGKVFSDKYLCEFVIKIKGSYIED